MTHATFNRRELPLTGFDGEVPMLDVESLGTQEEVAAPELAEGDLIHVDGRLWHVRSALTTAGSTNLQLKVAKRADASV